MALRALVRYASLRRLQMVLGLALIGFALAPGVSGAAQLDTATATGSGGLYTNVNINAQSGTSGQNASGTVSFTIFAPEGFVLFGPVTCLSVTGPDRGGGALGSPTTAILNFQDQGAPPNTGRIISVMLVDNGGNGADVISTLPADRAPTDCSPFPSNSTPYPSTLTNGRAIVFDAPPLPTSKDQCKKGGWRNYPQFKNQGDCVSFVNNGK